MGIGILYIMLDYLNLISYFYGNLPVRIKKWTVHLCQKSCKLQLGLRDIVISNHIKVNTIVCCIILLY